MRTIIQFFIVAISLLGCNNDKTDQSEANGVCDNRWTCEWTYTMFVNNYGPADKVQVDTIQSSGQLHWIRTIAYWHCERVQEVDGVNTWVPYVWLYTEFTDGNLVSWVYLDTLPY